MLLSYFFVKTLLLGHKAQTEKVKVKATSFFFVYFYSQNKNNNNFIFMSGAAPTYELVSLVAQRRALEDGIAIIQGVIDKEKNKKNNEDLMHELHERITEARALLECIRKMADDKEQVVVEK